MNILVCGARGFIGAALCDRLECGGHRVIRGVRDATAETECAIDYTIDYARDTEATRWDTQLRGIDVVINAVGILIENGAQTFEQIHHAAPAALFDACVRQGVPHVIQISALGAQTALTPYFRSKLAADSHLQSLPLRSCILRPALVYGAAGSSATFFRMLASLPVHPLPAGGHQPLRPIHVDEMTELVARWIDADDTGHRVIEAVGGEEVEYREMLSIYRRSMGFGSALQIGVPAGLIALGAALLDRIPGSMLTRDTWRMLQAGSTGNADATGALLERAPRGLRSFIAHDAADLRQKALDAWQPMLLKSVLSFVWIWTAIASLLLYPRSGSMALLARAHLHGAAATAAFYLAVALDFSFGILTLVKPRRFLWLAQAALIVGYSLIISVTMPETWFDPFGAILKNLPILAILLMFINQDS